MVTLTMWPHMAFLWQIAQNGGEREAEEKEEMRERSLSPYGVPSHNLISSYVSSLNIDIMRDRACTYEFGEKPLSPQ